MAHEGSTRRLLIRNIGDVNEQNIIELFNLARTEILKSTSRVEIFEEADAKHAAITVLAEEVPEVMKLSGVSFKGHDLVIVSETAQEHMETSDISNANNNNADTAGARETAAASSTEGDQTRSFEQSDERPMQCDIIFMILDVRSHPDLNFPPVSETEVCDALLQKTSDPHLAVKTGMFDRLGTFTIESIDMAPYEGMTLSIRGHDIPLKPIRKKGNRKGSREDGEESTEDHDEEESSRRKEFDPDTVKVRIFDANQVRYRDIPSEDFDNVFLSMGVDVTIPTLPERCKDRRSMLNANRYIIVKPYNEKGERIDMGGEIHVREKRFKIAYPGKVHYCFLCERKHGKECAKRVRFEALRNIRKGLTNEKKLYSDSTLRLTNQLALTTDVACMSGGGIGQICNLIPYDTHTHKEVIIHAGNNELKTESLQQFAYEVDTAAEKLKELATAMPVTLVVPPICEKFPVAAAKSQFLRDRLARVEELKIVHLTEVERDTSHHPTENGTKDIIQQIHRAQDESIILEDCLEDVTIPAIYRQVQTVFKAGCRGCKSLAYTKSLCEECIVRAEDTEVTELQILIDARMKEMFPGMLNSGKDGKKRPAETDNEMGTSTKLIKHNEDGTTPPTSSIHG